MNAYDLIYLEKAKIALGRMLDYAVYDLGYELVTFWDKFLFSDISKQFETGNVSIIAGRSGVELALMVIGRDTDYPHPSFSEEKSAEYWLGWALAHFQWRTCISFSQISEIVSIAEIRKMYHPYHEMDIGQFCDRLSEIYSERKKYTNIKRRRLALGMSQSELAKASGVPIRTLQQYEQGKRSINRARAEYVISLARALYIDPLQLLEA